MRKRPRNTVTYKIPYRYLPRRTITKRDYTKQLRNIHKSRKQYQKGIYVNRPKIYSFHNRRSNHVSNAKKQYKIDSIVPSRELANKTQCSLPALRQIVKKGEGAYYSSGSRPNQTAQSWGIARLASALTGGHASLVDFSILENGCDKKSPALIMAKQAAAASRTLKKHKKKG
jgi:hypothetical protein